MMRNRPKTWKRFGSCVAGIVAASSASAQQILLPTEDQSEYWLPPNVPGRSLILPQAGAPGRAATLLPPAMPLTEVTTPFAWKNIRAHPSLGYSFLHSDGLLSQPGEESSSIVQGIRPGVRIHLGDFWTLNYSPDAKFYSDEKFQNTVNHSASFNGFFPLDNWVFRVSQDYSLSKDPLIETGRQTEQQNFATGLSAHYQRNQTTSFDFSASQNINDADSSTSSRRWSTMNWVNFAVSERLSLGAGLGGGYTKISSGIEITSEQIMGRASWTPLEKLSLDLNGGVDIRQFVDFGMGSQFSPLFGASAVYTPFEATTMSLSVDQSTSTSLFGDQLTENISFSGSVRQRFLGKFHLQVTPGFQKTTYESILANLQETRSDETFSVATRLSMGFLKKGQVAVFYNVNENTSSDQEFGFTSRQTGFNISYRY